MKPAARILEGAVEAHQVSEVHCPGCGKRIRALNDDARRARMLVHIRNCNAIQRSARVSLAEAERLATEAKP